MLGVLYVAVFIRCIVAVFFFKQKTAYEMRISDWSSDVCSSDLAMSALRANPAPLLPSHVGVVIGLAVAKNLNSFSLQLFHRPRHVIRAETEVMNMLPHLFQAIAKRRAGADRKSVV